LGTLTRGNRPESLASLAGRSAASWVHRPGVAGRGIEMNDELEKRLRALINERIPYGDTAGKFDDVTMQLRWLEALVADAARIGAELEREACAQLVESFPDGPLVLKSYQPQFDRAAGAIRARGK
jgi:hypothetical protein